MAALRELGDSLECIVPHDLWPLPTYREMLFVAAESPIRTANRTPPSGPLSCLGRLSFIWHAGQGALLERSALFADL